MALLDEALAALEERLFWTAMDAGFATYGSALQKEVAGTEGALLDGLDGIPACFLAPAVTRAAVNSVKVAAPRN